MKRLNRHSARYAELAARTNISSSLGSPVATRANVAPWIAAYDVLPNPDPVLHNTSNTIDLFDAIRRECHVKACTKSRKAGVQRRKWKIEKYDARPQDTETVARIFETLDVRRMIRESLDGWGYGYKPLEILWRREGNLVVPFEIAGKPSRWFAFDNDSRLRVKKSGYTTEAVEPYKFLLAQYEASYDNPYGEAEYSLCFWPTTFKKGGLQFWAMYLEQFGIPHAIGKVRPGASERDKQDVLNMLTNLIRNAAGVIPNDTSVELLESKGGSGSSDLYWRHEHYHDGEISKVLLGHASAADSTPGRLGNDTSAMDVRSDIIDDDSVMVENTVNQLIRYIYELNAPVLAGPMPRFEIYDENDVDKARADRDFKLLNSKLVRFSEDYYLRTYDFRPGEVIVQEPPPGESDPVRAEIVRAGFKPAPAPSAPDLPSPQFAAPPSAADPAQSAVDDMIENGVPDTTLLQQADQLLEPLIALVESAQSFDELSAALPGLYPDLDSASIEAMLEKAMLLANIAGADL